MDTTSMTLISGYCELREIEVSDRIRTEYKDIEKLADSIKQFGQIEPIVVVKGEKLPWKLVAGERRYRACAIAGVPRIKFVVQHNTDPLLLKEIELEENIQRCDLSWSEEVAAKLALDRIKRQQAGQQIDAGRASRNDKWKLEDTAKLIGEDPSGTRRDIEIARAMEKDPKLAMYLSRFPKTRAWQKYQEYLKLKSINERKNLIDADTAKSQYFCGDCLQELNKVPDDSIHLILTDPPYGIKQIDACTEKAGNNVIETDNLNEEAHIRLMTALIPILRRKLKHGCFFFMFGGFEFYNFYRDLFSKNGFEFFSRPIIWYKERTTTPFYGYQFQSSYEVIYYGLKLPRSRQLLKGSKDLIIEHSVSTKIKQHIFEKPPKLLRQFIEQATFEGETVLDPFAGSFSTVIAALSCDRKAIAIELNAQHFALGTERVFQWKKDHLNGYKPATEK